MPAKPTAEKSEQVRVTLRAPASLVRALEQLALKEERSLSAEIRRLMRLHVEMSDAGLQEFA
jgi:hypothetical protein